MINSIVPDVSGFNANAYALTDARAKRETGRGSAPENGLRPEDYWTPDRMRNAIPYPMPETEAETKPEPHIPEKSTLPGDTNPSSAWVGEPQPQEYWTPDRMRNAIPYPMPETEPETKQKPLNPENSTLPEDTKPGSVAVDEPQPQEYWTPDRMRNAIPYPMPETEPETKPKPLNPENSTLPEDTKPGSVAADELQPEQHWVLERMREVASAAYNQPSESGGGFIQKYDLLGKGEWQQNITIRA